MQSITNIKSENDQNTQFSADINGRVQSGICKGSADWIALQQYINNLGGLDKALIDKTILPHVDLSEVPKEIARKELVALDKIMPRHLEELIDVLPLDAKETYLANKTSIEGMKKGDVKARKELLRGQL